MCHKVNSPHSGQVSNVVLNMCVTKVSSQLGPQKLKLARSSRAKIRAKDATNPCQAQTITSNIGNLNDENFSLRECPSIHTVDPHPHPSAAVSRFTVRRSCSGKKGADFQRTCMDLVHLIWSRKTLATRLCGCNLWSSNCSSPVVQQPFPQHHRPRSVKGRIEAACPMAAPVGGMEATAANRTSATNIQQGNQCLPTIQSVSLACAPYGAKQGNGS